MIVVMYNTQDKMIHATAYNINEAKEHIEYLDSFVETSVAKLITKLNRMYRSYNVYKQVK